MTAIGVLLRGALGPVAALIVSALLCIGAFHLGHARGMASGIAVERGRWETRLADDQARSARTQAHQAAVTAATSARLGERQARVRIVTETLIKEVPHYVTAQADARCDVPIGLVRLHDAAAAGLPAAADPAGRANDAASGLALSAVARTVTDNYGACRANAEALKGWQDWWAAVSAP